MALMNDVTRMEAMEAMATDVAAYVLSELVEQMGTLPWFSADMVADYLMGTLGPNQFNYWRPGMEHLLGALQIAELIVPVGSDLWKVRDDVVYADCGCGRGACSRCLGFRMVFRVKESFLPWEER